MGKSEELEESEELENKFLLKEKNKKRRQKITVLEHSLSQLKVESFNGAEKKR